MTAVDLRRTVHLRIVDDLPDRDPAATGASHPRTNGVLRPC